MLPYAATIFLSAFLLFQVQPLIARFILPWFGGSPAVWTTCMLFFQVLLLAGYAWADWSARRLGPRRQVAAQVAILALAVVLLPIAPDPGWKPTAGQDPTGRILLLLAGTVGAPYLVLATSAPLLQSWFSRRFGSPYWLYALSNGGSLLGLVSYPFIVEPLLSLRQQSWLWSSAFVLYALGFSLCGAILLRARGVAEAAPLPMEEPRAAEGVRRGDRVLWILLPACGSVVLLATTNQLCQDIAVVPLLWVLPLGLYLVSFIVCFGSERAYERAAFVPSTGLCLAALAMLWGQEASVDTVFQIALHCAALFGCCMICHGELVRLKPPAVQLTAFYLAVALGGALGGVFVALVAPRVFDLYLEFPIALVGTALLWLVAVARDPRSALHGGRPRWAWAVLCLLVLTYAGVSAERVRFATDGYDSVDRNFYGVVRTYTEPDPEFGDDVRILLHGSIDHGSEYLAPGNRLIPTSYYGPETGIGVAARHQRADGPRRIGVVGLGAGALAAYARKGDELRFYEINPLMVAIAHERFFYLSECPATWDVVPGDARLVLERELEETGGRGRGYDLLAIDAFSGDAPPAHLLTREAFQLYLRHLAPDGILAVNVSNTYVDLVPLVWRIAEAEGVVPLLYQTAADASVGRYDADWILMSPDPSWVDDADLWNASVEIDAEELEGFEEVRIWTDDHIDLFQLLIR